MSSDPSSLESDLRRLRAAAADESLLARLEACAEGTWTQLDPAETAMERRLRACQPVQLPAALMAALESAVGDVRFPNDEKIVPFPNAGSAMPRRHRGWWSAAAAVALTGAAAALLMPVKHGDVQTAANPPKSPVSSPVSPRSNEKGFVPAGFNRGLSEASDEGVIWQSHDRPQRVLKVVYTDRVTLRDSNGRTCQVEQPRVEYILVPAKTD